MQNGSSVSLTGTANQVLVTGSISLSGTGTLDVRDKTVILNYSGASPIEAIRASITSGYNGGAWNGSGVRSLTAATTPGTAVGFGEATDLFSTFPATFAGQTVDNTSVLSPHPWRRRQPRPHDEPCGLQPAGVQLRQSPWRWSTGDFNYDVNANLGDFNLLAGNFGAMGPTGRSSDASLVSRPSLGPPTLIAQMTTCSLDLEFAGPPQTAGTRPTRARGTIRKPNSGNSVFQPTPTRNHTIRTEINPSGLSEPPMRRNSHYPSTIAEEASCHAEPLDD